jgi:lipopolysaccharide cholinephosphotransferase
VDSLRELQLTELEILKDTLLLFEKNNIHYYALGGTMLGAVRHHGFIPWDDDVDIGLPREDYDRLYEVRDQLPSRLRYCSFQEDPSYPYYIARITDKSVIVKSDRTENEEITPAWIDIFPLDGLPNRLLLRKLHEKTILLFRMLFQISRFDDVVNTKRTNRPLSEKIVIRCAKTFHLQRWLNRDRAFWVFDRTLRHCPYAQSAYNINAMGAYKLREAFDKTVFGEGAFYDFEDIRIRGPVNYEAYLTQLYGNWRTPADFTHHGSVEIVRADADSR